MQGIQFVERGRAAFVAEALEPVLRLARRGAIRIRPVLRDVVPAARAPEIYATLASDPARLLGTVFDWT